MEWTVDSSNQNPCRDFRKFKSRIYGVCMKVTLPRALVGHFQKIQGKLNFIAFGYEDKSRKLSYYTAPCTGDSGSGHWITIDEKSSSESITKQEITDRRALVAVYTESLNKEFKLGANKPWLTPICGSSLSVKGHKFPTVEYAQRTTHEDVLKFIKYWVFNTKH